LSNGRGWGGQCASLKEFLAETRLLWLVWLLMCLPWWHDRTLTGPLDPTLTDTPAYRRDNRDELYRQLSCLLGEIT